jgi:hypothetical protein
MVKFRHDIRIETVIIANIKAASLSDVRRPTFVQLDKSKVST